MESAEKANLNLLSAEDVSERSESSASKSSPDSMVYADESDDETTLREEEGLSNETEISHELEDLHAESELPLDQLLKRYGMQSAAYCHPDSRSGGVVENGNDASGPSSKKKRRVESEDNSRSYNFDEDACSDRVGVVSKSEGDENSTSGSDSSSDDSDFIPFVPSLPPKEPRIGEQFQIEVDSFKGVSCAAEDSRTEYRAEDVAECLWSPEVVKSVDQVEAQLRSWLRIPKSVTAVPDNSDWLYSVYKASGDLSVPLPPLASSTATANSDPVPNINTTKTSVQCTDFSDEEIVAFERGLSEWGKNFFTIQRLFLPNRSVGQLVFFYYFWKKSERYDNFAAMYKLSGRGRHLLDEDITDFMFRIANDIHVLPQQPINAKEASSHSQTSSLRTASAVPESAANVEPRLESMRPNYQATDGSSASCTPSQESIEQGNSHSREVKENRPSHVVDFSLNTHSSSATTLSSVCSNATDLRNIQQQQQQLSHPTHVFSDVSN